MDAMERQQAINKIFPAAERWGQFETPGYTPTNELYWDKEFQEMMKRRKKKLEEKAKK